MQDPFKVPADAESDRARVKLIHNEQTKLTATVANAVAIAFLIGGGVAPLLSVSSGTPGVLALVLSPVWFCVGVVIHLGARAILRSLK